MDWSLDRRVWVSGDVVRDQVTRNRARARNTGDEVAGRNEGSQA